MLGNSLNRTKTRHLIWVCTCVPICMFIYVSKYLHGECVNEEGFSIISVAYEIKCING